VNVVFQVRPCVDQLGIGILQTAPAIRVVERRSIGEDITDCRINCAGEETMGLLETGNDLRCHTTDEGEGTRRLPTF
jgi:hypothetical protein